MAQELAMQIVMGLLGIGLAAMLILGVLGIGTSHLGTPHRVSK
jgi:hypothetical protein